MQVNEFLEKSAKTTPDKPAVFFNEKWMTYADIEINANRLGNFLKNNGIERHDRIAILCNNSFEYIISYFAISKIGGISVPLNSTASTREIEYIIHSCEAKALLTNRMLKEATLAMIPTLKMTSLLVCDQEELCSRDDFRDIRVFGWEEAFQDGSSDPPSIPCIDLDLESIVFTSGSTGVPKGVMLTHLNTVSNMYSICQYLKLTGSDRIMAILPFSYIYGKSLLLTHFCVGGSVVIDNRFLYPNLVLESMVDNEVTGFAGVPSTFAILLHRSDLLKMEFKTLRYVTQAGGAMAPSVQKKVVEAFAPAQVYIMYGATEAAPRLSYLDPTLLSRKLGSIGKAVPNVELFIVDENGRKLSPGETGEIAARGSNIMKGYWNEPEETARVLRDGMYFTGDLGMTDDEGFFYVVGRKNDFIKVKGFRVSAKEIEEIILEMEGIHEAAVIGVEDEILGEAVKTFVVLKENSEVTKDSILRHIAANLQPYKAPKYIEFCRSLPKNASGKILKSKLK